MVATITIDADGPLIESNGKTFDFFDFCRRRGIDCDYQIYANTGNWTAAMRGCTRPVIDELWLEFSTTVSKKADQPTAGAQEALRQLNDWRRCIATARGENVRQATESFLDLHYGRFHEYHFSLDHKAAAVRRCGPGYFVDDNIGVARQVATRVPGVVVILFPSPGLVRQNDHPRITMLEAEKRVYKDLPPSDPEWHSITRHAWEEIIEIVQMVPA